MRASLMPIIFMGFLVGAGQSVAIAAGPRVSEDVNWPGMARTQRPNDYRPDAASQCGIYDNYCYNRGRLSLDNSTLNR